MTTTRKSYSNLGAALIAAVLAGSSGAALASQVTLSGDQEVPPVSTSAKGSGNITVGTDKTVTGSVNTSGISGTMAHIHEGAPGTSGPPIITLKKSGNTWSVPPGSKLSDAQYQSYQAGNLYVNVHSNKHKDGEIRGQIKP